MEIDLLCGTVWGTQNDNRIKHYFLSFCWSTFCVSSSNHHQYLYEPERFAIIHTSESRNWRCAHASSLTILIIHDDGEHYLMTTLFCVTNQFINIRKWHPRGSWLSMWHFKELKNIKGSSESSTSVVVRDSFLLLSRMMMLQEFKREAEHEKREENNS